MIYKRHHNGHSIYWHVASGYSVEGGETRYRTMAEAVSAIDAHLAGMRGDDLARMTDEDRHWETLSHDERQRFRRIAAQHDDGAVAIAYRMRGEGK